MNIGDVGTGTCDHVRISSHRSDKRIETIILVLEYGTLDEGSWVENGIVPSIDSSFPISEIINGSDYTTLTTTHESNDSELSFDAHMRSLYEYLQANYPSLAGTIV